MTDGLQLARALQSNSRRLFPTNVHTVTHIDTKFDGYFHGGHPLTLGGGTAGGAR